MNAAQELAQFLEHEQSLILAGDFSALENLISKKEAISDRLARSSHEISTADIARLRNTSRRNDALLRSMQKGLLAAKSQIAESIGGNQTYGCDGGKSTLTPQSSVEKKL
mgnify:FL=1